MSGPPAPPAATPGQAMRDELINRWTARGHCVDGRSWDLLPQVDRDDLEAAAQAAIAAAVAAGRERLPEVWSDAVPPGGMVCAVPSATHPDGICGMPVESEPCNLHLSDEYVRADLVEANAAKLRRERDDARKQLAATQAIARMLQATAGEILDELWPGPRYDGVSEDFREMQAKVDEWRARLAGDHA